MVLTQFHQGIHQSILIYMLPSLSLSPAYMGVYLSCPLLEGPEQEPKSTPKGPQVLLDVLDTYGGLSMLGDVFRQQHGHSYGWQIFFP